MPHILLDFDPPQPDAPSLGPETSDLVYFLSWAFATRYGGSHELATAALILRTEFKLDLVPLLTFADRDIEDPADQEALDRAWQDAAPLAECCEAGVTALNSDDRRLTTLRDEYPHLSHNIQALGQAAAWAAQRGARIRVTYLMAD